MRQAILSCEYEVSPESVCNTPRESEFLCSYCDRPFKKVDLDEHEKRCRKRPRGIRNSSKVEAKEKRAEARSKVAAYLRPCAVCGRTFSEDRIATHQKICRKVKKKETSRRRHGVKGINAGFQTQHHQKKTEKGKIKPKVNVRGGWKNRSEALRQTIRRAKLITKYENEGNEFKLMEIARETESPLEDDFQPCKTCGRTFAPAALKRHAPICKNLRSARPKGLGRFQSTDWAIKSMTAKPRPKKQAAKQGVPLYGPSTFGGWREPLEDASGGSGIRMTNETSADNPMVRRSMR